ncbi:MAG TPA: response regulator [Thermodesulfobacteriota bacterium]
MAGRHLLVVDDEPDMRGLIAEYLGDHGFRVSTTADGRETLGIVEAQTVDLIILDLKLAGEDGLKLLRDLRGRSNVPVVVVTGHRRDEVDRIVGFELGADDYLTKPFSLRELLARVRAVLRRATAGPAPARDRGGETYRFAGWELDARARRLTSPTGRLVTLTRGEFGLLLALVRAPQRVLSREQLLAASRVHHDDVYDRSIDVQVLRLRRKLEVDPSVPQLIRTERGVGYVLAVPVEVR